MCWPRSHKMNNSSPHVNFESLVDHVVGELNDAASTRHIEECSECGLEANHLSRLVSTMRTDDSENAPAYAIAALLRAYDERPGKVADGSRPTLGERIRAVLSLDSLTLGPAMGFRSTGAADARQIIFTSDAGTVDLRISKQNEAFNISGQMIGHLSGGEMSIENGENRRTTEVNDDGSFSFVELPKGSYLLSFRTGVAIVEFPEFSVE